PVPGIDAVDELGRTPLHLAVFNENLGLATILLDAGANPSAIDLVGPVIHYAQMRMNMYLMTLLIKRGADLNALHCYGWSGWDRLVDTDVLWVGDGRRRPIVFLGGVKLPSDSYVPSNPDKSRQHVIDCLVARVKKALAESDDIKRSEFLFRLAM